jgi:hypothetical protein
MIRGSGVRSVNNVENQIEILRGSKQTPLSVIALNSRKM